jgi:PKD domain
MNIKYAIILLLLGYYQSDGQNIEAACEAEQFFRTQLDCDPSLRGLKCVELDVRHSLDKEGKEFTYAWNFGDGNTKTGYLSEYCYKNYGSYIISLDLIDPKTSLVVRNELTTSVRLLPPIDFGTDTLTERAFNFRYNPELMPGIVVEKVFWKIEDSFSCGETTYHSFEKEGLHILQVGVLGKQDGSDFSGCTLMGVFINIKK